MRETVCLIIVFSLTNGSYLSADTANRYRAIELQQRMIIVKGEEDFEKVELVGTVTELKPTRGSHPHLKWLVTLQVDIVISGAFEEQTFSFAIHSPTKSGVEKSGQYVIDLARVQNDKYILKSIEPWIAK